jgi:hypothetical protein
MKMYAPRTINIGTEWRYVVRFMPRPLYPHINSSRYSLDRRLGEPQNWSGRCGEKRHVSSRKQKPFFLACPACKLISTLTEELIACL